MKIRAHETFCIRKGWLHKGVKNIQINSRLFTNKTINPCDLLGIGTNMVKSLRYWLTAVGVMEEVSEGSQKKQQLTELGKVIDQYDKYYEEDGTNWLIHYKLASNDGNATAWYWFFNKFNCTSFDKTFFVSEFLEFLKTEYGYEGSVKMLEDEFDCIIKTYCSKDKEVNPEETNECPLVDLKLVEWCGDKTYRKACPDKDAVHPLVAFAVMVDCFKSDEILISDLIEKPNSIGKIFNLDKATLFYVLEQLEKMGYISIARTAGLDVIKIKQRIEFIEAVTKYYQMIG